MGSNHDLFNYTSGRFLYNERLRLEERYVKFEPEAMKTVLENETNLSRGRLTHLYKLAEGGFNRVFSAVFEDESHLIVKIPYPLTVPKKLTTASEVATLDLLGTKGIPVPRVVASSSTTDNQLGVEYIVMEPAKGISLDTKWFDLLKKKGQAPAVMRTFAEIERRLFDIPFGSFGSVYYKSDIPLHLQHPLYASNAPDENGGAGRFCIGPVADPMFWYGRRESLDLDRGPCKREYSSFQMNQRILITHQGMMLRSTCCLLVRKKWNGLVDLAKPASSLSHIILACPAKSRPMSISSSSRNISRLCLISFLLAPRIQPVDPCSDIQV